MAFASPLRIMRLMTSDGLCTLELIVEHERVICPGADCPFWDRSCVLDEVSPDLVARPEFASTFLRLRRELEQAGSISPLRLVPDAA